MDDRWWVLWDGECGFCRKAAMHLARRDPHRRLRIVPYQEAPAPPMTPAVQIQAARALQVIDPSGRRFSGGRAVLTALGAAGWHPTAMRILQMPPSVWIIELGYRLVARNRARLGWLLPDPDGEDGQCTCGESR